MIYPAPAPLTSVKQNTKLAGEIMVDSVLKLVRGGAVKAQRDPNQLNCQRVDDGLWALS
ncbi:hypothetical protein KT99_12089 [Shewanella benthica KT99]|uniref:Uncharacterized protein n=1 Tax=Shewanella benthica KT99 TaxID=314608 RepID=A9EK48_9GAMM|nr:hypothetical protein KT99_12089 [Shewanella benthica KT99]